MQYIESSLINLYKNGIISSQDLDELRKEEYSRVNLGGRGTEPMWAVSRLTVHPPCAYLRICSHAHQRVSHSHHHQ